MNRYYEEIKEKVEDEVPNMKKGSIYALIGYINAFVEMGKISTLERKILFEMITSKGYISRDELSEAIEFG